MLKVITTALVLAVSSAALAQESHYHRALRSQDSGYGLTQEPHFNGSGMYWSRTRDANDTAILEPETPADSIARRQEFMRLCRLAYDAYDVGDAYHTIMYGDSALTKRYHTPDLYFFMAVSFEKLSDYKDADYCYRKAMASGYAAAARAYPEFKQRMKQARKEEKLRRKEKKHQ